MKVILAGMPKTGTKSMVVALQDLGMNVYDFMEHYEFLHDDWIRISKKGGDTEDFRRMYQGVDAVTDLPVCYFWEELLKAFPEAKIILTVRDDEESCMKSTKTQMESFRSSIMKLMQILSPTFRSFLHFAYTFGNMLYKQPPENPNLNELLFRKVYRRHNAYVAKSAPKNQLLIYNVKDGWKPLCNFLGVDVPAKPFPHKNKQADATNQMMSTNRTFIKMQREMTISLLLITGVVGCGCYKAVKLSLLSNAYHYFTSLLP